MHSSPQTSLRSSGQIWRQPYQGIGSRCNHNPGTRNAGVPGTRFGHFRAVAPASFGTRRFDSRSSCSRRHSCGFDQLSELGLRSCVRLQPDGRGGKNHRTHCLCSYGGLCCRFDTQVGAYLRHFGTLAQHLCGGYRHFGTKFPEKMDYSRVFQSLALRVGFELLGEKLAGKMAAFGGKMRVVCCRLGWQPGSLRLCFV